MTGDSRESKRSTGRRKRPGGRRHPDIEVARLLVKRGFLPKEVALSALKEQRTRAQEKQPRVPFLQLLVKKRVLSPERLTEVQDELRRHTYLCPSCEARAILVPSSQSGGAACPRCGSRIDLDAPSGGAPAPNAAEFGSGRDLLLAPPGLEKFSQGTLAFGRYEVISEIGRGAMGVVYRANHKTLGKEVALKVLLTGEDAREAQVARFRREAAAVQKLKHEGIVPVHDFGSEGEIYFLTMELVPGGLTLHKLWKDPQTAPELKTRLGHVVQVANAIHYANRRGVIHRDLKPANVLISPEGEALVADFGLAKDEEDELGLTRSEDRLGTPLFMAPEQVRRGSSAVDNRVDVWALGVILFLGVTGRYPFRGRTIMDLYLKILNEDPDWTGERSEVPDRDFGQAPKPSEVRSIERKRRTSDTHTVGLDETAPLSATDVASYAVAKARKESADRKTSAERKALSSSALSSPPLSGPPPFVPPPDLAGKDVPRDLRLVIEMALAKDPERRYESAGELARDLERFLAGEQVRARPPGKLGRIWRRVKRHRMGVAIALLVVAAPTVVWLESARREAHEQEEAARKKAEDSDAQAKREARGRQASEQADQIWQHAALEKHTLPAWKQAAVELTHVCESFPDEPAPLLARGLAHAVALERDEARADLSRAQKLLAPRALDEKASLGPPVAARGVSLAWALGDWDAAVLLARLGLAADQKDETLTLGLARALLAQGKLEAARDALGPLVDLGNRPRVHALAAEVALARKDVHAAAELAKTSLSSSPDEAFALTIRGLAGLAQAEPQAAQFLRRARESREAGFAAKGGDLATLCNELGRTLRRDAKDPESAVGEDDLAARLAPWSPVPCFWGADTRLRDLRDVPAALESLGACLARDPTFAEAAELRAELLLACRDEAGVARAERAFRDELAHLGSDRAHLDLAVVLLGKGDLDDAAHEIASAQDRESLPRAQLLSYELERRRGNTAAADKLRSSWQQGRAGALARRDLVAVARARLLSKDFTGALEAAQLGARNPERDPRWEGFRRLPNSYQVARALEAAALAALGQSDAALAALAKASSKSAVAPEATPALLRTAPEFARLREDPAFAKLLSGSPAKDAADDQ